MKANYINLLSFENIPLDFQKERLFTSITRGKLRQKLKRLWVGEIQCSSKIQEAFYQTTKN